MEACPAKAIYKRDDGAVIIDPDKCRGHKLCIAACPYENVIYFNDALNISQKCTFCAHLLDNGWKETRCADACPTGAFTFGDESDPKIKELMIKAQPLKPELKVKPRVFYVGLPKKFIAGAVYDAQKKECVGEATVTLTDTKDGGKITTKTDSYGDFWFKELAKGTYTLLIEKSGYQSHMMGPVDATQKDINVGMINIFEKGK
jgi:NAD-dependent dihydropyrimidine dehydrogenase PreA subunit